MITDETKRKLRELRLTAMVDALEIQEQNPDYRGMSFDDRFQLIVDGTYDNQQSNRLTRLIRQANFSTNEPCVSDIDYREDRQLDRNLILSLAVGNYIKEGHNIILKGAAGCGKTWQASIPIIINFQEKASLTKLNQIMIFYCKKLDQIRRVREFYITFFNIKSSINEIKNIEYQEIIFKIPIVFEEKRFIFPVVSYVSNPFSFLRGFILRIL